MTIKFGILRADDVLPDLAATYGEYPDMFVQLLRHTNERRGDDALTLDFASYDVHRRVHPAELDECDVYLVTGSSYSVYDDEPWIEELSELVRRIHDARKKLVGVCFGHQLVAHALGGETRLCDAGWGLGVHRLQVNEQGEARGCPVAEFQLLHSHRDQVATPAPGSVVLAGNDFCPVAMTALGDHIFTVQGHPEFSNEYAEALFAKRRANYPPHRYQSAVESLSEPTDRELLASWILEFAATR